MRSSQLFRNCLLSCSHLWAGSLAFILALAAPITLQAEEKHHHHDLGNLTTDDKGGAKYELVVGNITLAGKKNPIIGRGIIVHAKVDDGGQPTGNAGAQIGYGVS